MAARIVQRQVEVNENTATKIADADPHRTDLVVRNDGAFTIRLGGSDVTNSGTPATCGLGIAAGDPPFPITSAPQGGASGAGLEWYVITETAGASFYVSVLEVFAN